MGLIKNEYPFLERDTEQTAVIMPNRKNEYVFPPKCVFAFLGDITDNYAAKNKCEKIAEFESITKIFPIYKTMYKGEEICFCQGPCGASAATQILDFLISYGVKHIISCGSCGELHDFSENQIIVPISALRDEGTSYHYVEPARYITINQNAVEATKYSVINKNLEFCECRTWTTDGFYRETKEMVKYRKDEGCAVVEMECSALAACAEFRGVIFGQILFTADTLANIDTYDDREWGKSSYEIVLDLSFEAVCQVNRLRD